MNHVAKQLWLDALRSDEYKQGEGKLHRTGRPGRSNGEDRFCCLGVLCDVVLKQNVLPTFNRINIGNDFTYTYDGEDNYLPESVIRWAELPDNANMGGGVARKLARMNDNGNSFEEIAEYIEREL